MDDSDAKRSRIKARIAASQARLHRDSLDRPVRQPLPDSHPPEDYRTLAAEYPWLTVAGGLAAGLLLGALLPKAVGGTLAKRARPLLTIAAEMGLALSRQALTAADSATDVGASKFGAVSQRLTERTGELRGRARETANAAVGTARSAGMQIASEAIRFAARSRN